jgi:serine/threonine protein kinase
MEFLPGGDLYSVLQKVGSLDECSARTYAAQILAAIRYLHSNHIIHRDLKPDNVLIAPNGHLKLADFGLSYLPRGSDIAVALSPETASLVGTPDYVAPEIIQRRPHSFAVDYWALGIMIYEFLHGVPPFHSDNLSELYARITSGRFEFGEISPEARDLITRLLNVAPERRLGAGGIREILEHPWFAGVCWDEVDRLPPPFVPRVSEDAPDTDYFEERHSGAATRAAEEDIYQDMCEASRGSANVRRAVRHDSLPPSPIVDVLAHEFPAVAVGRLGKVNGVIANKMRRRGSSADISVRMGFGQIAGGK